MLHFEQIQQLQHCMDVAFPSPYNVADRRCKDIGLGYRHDFNAVPTAHISTSLNVDDQTLQKRGIYILLLCCMNVKFPRPYNVDNQML